MEWIRAPTDIDFLFFLNRSRLISERSVHRLRHLLWNICTYKLKSYNESVLIMYIVNSIRVACAVPRPSTRFNACYLRVVHLTLHREGQDLTINLM